MEIEKTKRPSARKNKSVPISIRVLPEVSEWLKYKEISPTLLFEEACKELMEKENAIEAEEENNTSN